MRRTLLEVVVVLFLRGLGAIGMLGVTAVAVRTMSPDESGLFLLGMTVLLVASPISVFGLPIYSLRLVGARKLEEDAGEIRHIALKSQLIAFGTTCLIATALAIAAPSIAQSVFGKPNLQEPLRWLTPGIVATGTGLLVAHHFQGIAYHLQSIFVLAIGGPLFSIAGMLAYPMITGSELTPVVAAKIYSASCWLNLAIGFLSWQLSLPSVKHSKVDWSEAASACFAFWAVQVMVLLVTWSGQLAAGAWVSPADYAQLAVASRMANVVNFLLIGVNFVVAPKLSRLWAEEDRDALRNLVTLAAFATTLIAFPLMLAIFMFADSLMGLIRPDFAAGGTLLAILAVAQFHNVATGSVNTLLSMCGYERELRNIVICSGTIAILLSIILTWQFGVVGAASATAISLILQNSLAMWGVKYHFGFWMFDRFLFWRARS